MRNIIKTFAVLIILYLVLIHFTGFSKDVATLGGAGKGLVEVFQGR